MRYGIIGVGSIAAAIVTGLAGVQGGAAAAPEVLLSPRGARRAADLARRFGTVRVAPSNQAVVDGADVLVLCLRPQDAPAALRALRFRADQAVISVMAALPLSALRPLVSPARDLARSIPLPAVADGTGVTPICPPTPAASALFSRLGTPLELTDEAQFEALSAASATVAAFYALLGTVTRWLTDEGLEEHTASRYVASVFGGALAPLAGGAAADFGQLARAHQTPGGLNEQFLRGLERAGTFGTVEEGLRAVRDRLRSAGRAEE